MPTPTLKKALVAEPAHPISNPSGDTVMAPWPSIDKYPIIIGPGLSLAYISSIFRLSLVGYRQQYVDLLEELLEKEPHGYSVLQKRILGCADGKIVFTASRKAKTEAEKARALEIASQIEEWFWDIPNIRQHIASLLWANYYAIAACEIHWKEDGSSWVPERLSFIHSRRLSYPMSGAWDLYIWDQGSVLPWDVYGKAPTNAGPWGLKIADYPGKFIVHAPQIRGSYPTREGLGRQLAYWFALKLIASRGAPQYLERFAKPWPEAVYKTGSDGEQRGATKEDVEQAQAALKAMGGGSLSSWVHADTVTLDLKTVDNGRPKLTFKDWIEICNNEISKAVLGSTLGTDVGSTGGNRSLGETMRKSEISLLSYDGSCVAATLQRDLFSWMMRLNFPNEMDLSPCVDIHVEDDPDPMMVVERAVKAASGGVPVDADALAEMVGLPVTNPNDHEARRMAPYAMLDAIAFDADLAAKARAVASLAPQPTGMTGGAKPSLGDGGASAVSPGPDGNIQTQP